MKNQYYLILSMLLFVTSNLFPQQTSDNLKGLRKIWNVAVIIDNSFLSSLDENKLKVEIELKLRQSKIVVESNNEPQPFSPSTLVVEVRGISTSDNTYVGEVLVNLHEAISILRSQKQAANGLTWYYRSQLIPITDSKMDLLREEIFYAIDKFINDYLSVNGQQ